MPRSKQSRVVARHAFVQLLLEHLDAGDDRLARLAEADDFHFLADLHLAALDSSRHHRAASLNRKNVFNRHQERLVQFARRLRHTLVHRRHQLVDLRFRLRFPIQRVQCRNPHHRHIVARKLVRLQQLAHFQLHQLEQLRIIHRIAPCSTPPPDTAHPPDAPGARAHASAASDRPSPPLPECRHPSAPHP